MHSDQRARTEGVICWLLHKRAWQRSSAIWELLSEDGERLAAVARGVRTVSRRQASAPDLCGRLRIWYRGRGDLKQLQRYERETSPSLAGSALLYALAANELIMRATRRLERNPGLPEHYDNLLRTLQANRNGREQDWHHLRFQLGALRTLGYGVDLERDATGMGLDPDGHYQLDGGFAVQRVEDAGPNRQGRVSGADLLSLLQTQMPGEVGVRTLRELVRKLLRLAVPNGLQAERMLPGHGRG